MKTVEVAELKSHLSEYIKSVQDGDEIQVINGKTKQTIALIVSPDKHKSNRKRAIGSLKDKFTVEFKKDYKMDMSDLV